jgi:hypothetical protein
MATVLASRPKVWTSLLRAAEELDAARSAAEIRGAIRTGLFGLEFQLDTLAKELALDPGAPGALEPVVLNRARAVEATLRSLLIEGWALLTVVDVELETQTGAQKLARDLRSAASRDLEMVFDHLFSPQGID